MSIKKFIEKYSPKICRNVPEILYPLFLKIIYQARTGHKLNLKNPKRISEKIQWLKLYDNLPIKTILTDKLLVRDWVKQRAGNLNFPELYGVWDSFDEIEFEILPQAFYLKTNHGCAMNIEIKNKERFLREAKEEVGKIFKKWLSENFAYSWGFELQYKNIIPKVYAEERLFIAEHQRVSDYKIWCMNGKARFIEYNVYPLKSKIEDVRLAIYDTEWNPLPFTHGVPKYEGELPRPERLEEMVATAETLSKDFKFVRVDLIDIYDKLYFAELTFTPYSGHMVIVPDDYDYILGDMLNLNS